MGGFGASMYSSCIYFGDPGSSASSGHFPGAIAPSCCCWSFADASVGRRGFILRRWPSVSYTGPVYAGICVTAIIIFFGCKDRLWEVTSFRSVSIVPQLDLATRQGLHSEVAQLRSEAAQFSGKHREHATLVDARHKVSARRKQKKGVFRGKGTMRHKIADRKHASASLAVHASKTPTRLSRRSKKHNVRGKQSSTTENIAWDTTVAKQQIGDEDAVEMPIDSSSPDMDESENHMWKYRPSFGPVQESTWISTTTTVSMTLLDTNKYIGILTGLRRDKEFLYDKHTLKNHWLDRDEEPIRLTR